MAQLRKLLKNRIEKLGSKTRNEQKGKQRSDSKFGKRRYQLQSLFLVLILSILSACGDSALEKLDQEIAADAEARRGVYVNLSTDLQTAIATPDNQTDIELRRTLLKNDNEYPQRY